MTLLTRSAVLAVSLFVVLAIREKIGAVPLGELATKSTSTVSITFVSSVPARKSDSPVVVFVLCRPRKTMSVVNVSVTIAGYRQMLVFRTAQSPMS